ncbi:hypothetical protein M431DRAFT_475101 [Trichoderma harzianum CBS 226.95]|jgi:hypothetical protein|uniref:Uncharacterized protein n=1 Tax=Trichoderma harzianum CBS 226.95 TaxID=983964 RepID=A0A2T4A7A3_TRIHA|nr:hypothetical protein M431DRAFT_475101 [Trichoderma harzianum CBS 226.95]PTB52916.1 hypothetical protein M431DRAFT_475101 [Trichoderma harzianum CBS 226.95]
MVSVVRRVRGCQAMPNAQQRDRQRQIARWREGEKAVDESQKGTTRALEEPSKRRQHSGICGRKPRLPVVRPSPVDKSRWAVTLANDHRPSPLHLGSIESWCNADPPTPRWHTPLTLVRGQALRWTPSSTPNRKSVLVRAWSRNKYRPRAMGLFCCGTPSHHSGDSLSASLQAVRAQLWSRRRGGRDLQMLAGRRFVDCCSV